MDTAKIIVMKGCSTGSVRGTLTFPQVAGCLADLGVESYHADLYRLEKTYYLPDGSSHVEPEDLLDPAECGGPAIAQAFSEEGVAAAVAAVQRAEIDYVTFLRRIAAAGCTGYWVYLAGRKVVYAGRQGEMHTEHFPGSQ